MKKISIFALLLSLVVLCMGSCFILPGGDEAEGPSADGGENKVVENLIYDSSTTIYIVYNAASVTEENVNLLMNALVGEGISVELRPHTSSAAEHEIVIGNIGRDASDEAITQLERIEKNSPDDLRYCIYSTGSSVAIVYDEDADRFGQSAAVEKFVKDYVKSSLALAKGAVEKKSFDLYEYLEQKDLETMNGYWQALSNRLGDEGEELVSALRALYSLYQGEELVSWLANLYEPDLCVCKGLYGEEKCQNTQWCHTGGFYFSNSARNTVGFLPDIESTIQALNFINGCGMLKGVGDNYSDLLPDEVDTAIKMFAYNLQDPDGFFYHPQWGTSIGTSRRARDYNWATRILANYGMTPKYKTLSDVPSVDEVSYKGISERLGASTASAVSKVVLMESETLVPDHLKSIEAFEEYLIGLDIKNNSYSAGNTLSAQTSQIKTRGAEYGELLISHLDAINIEYGNGTWHHTVNYDAINGVMKISGVYSGFKAPIPNAAKACLASFAAVSSDETVGSIVDIWNAWEALDRVLTNIRSYGRGGEAEAIVSEILPDAADAVLATREKLTIFLQQDGSFIYQASGKTSGMSMGAPVSVVGTAEGDLNATLIATVNMVDAIFHSLRIGSAVPIALVTERTVFLNILRNIRSVNKTGSYEEASNPVTFDFYDDGEVPSELRIFGKGDSKIIPDERDEEGKVFLFNSIIGNGDYFKLNTSGSANGAVGLVFESELCIGDTSSVNSGLFRLEMGADGDSNAYRLTFGTTDSGIDLIEHSSSSSSKDVSNILTTVDYGQWFKLKVIYYKGDHDTARIKIYIDDKLLAISDNYFDQDGEKLEGEGTPAKALSVCRFYVLKNYELDLYVDNIRSYYTKKNYEYEPLAQEYRYLPEALNVDSISEEKVVFDFNGAAVPEELSVSESGSSALKSVGTEGMLSLSEGASVTLAATKRSATANVSSLSFDLSLGGASAGEVVAVSLLDRNKGGGTIFSVTVKVVGSGNSAYAVLLDGDGNEIEGVRLSVSEKNSLTIDCYTKEGGAVIYLNGKRVGMCVISGSKKLSFGKATVGSLSSEILIDNLTVEKKDGDYISATSPEADAKIYDFSDGIDPDITLVGSGISVDEAGGDPLLKQVTASAHSSFTLPVYIRDESVNCTEFSLDLTVRSTQTEGVARLISLKDEEGNIILAFALVIKDGKLGIAESTSMGTHSPIAYTNLGEEVSLVMEYYENIGKYKIILNGELAFESGLVYSSDSAEYTPVFITVSSAEVGGVALFDNLSLSRYSKVYLKPSATKNPESGKEEYTFDYSSGTNYPSGISHDINSGAPAPFVTEVNKDGSADKALVFTTYKDAGSMDELKFDITKSTSGAKSFVFSSDLMIENTSGGSTFLQIQMRDGTKSQIELTIGEESGKIVIYQKNYESGKNGEKITLANKGEWFRLSAEIYLTDGGFVSKIFLDGELLFVSDTVYKDYSGADSLDTVIFKALKGPAATMYLDNFSFVGSTVAFDGAEIDYKFD